MVVIGMIIDRSLTPLNARRHCGAVRRRETFRRPTTRGISCKISAETAQLLPPRTASCKLSRRCDVPSDERGAGNLHATFWGSRCGRLP